MELGNYVEDLIKTANQESGIGKKKNSVVISEFIEEIEAAAKAICGSKIKLKFHSECEDGHILVDNDRMIRAIKNIILNGFQHTLKAGTENEKTISIELYTCDEYLVIEVNDTGDGFSKESLEHAKEKFYMGDKSRSGMNNHGMGLYIADTIIKEHDGELQLKNGECGGNVSVKLLMKEEIG